MEEQVIDAVLLVHQELQALVVQVAVQIITLVLVVLPGLQVTHLQQLQHKVLLVEMVDLAQVLMDLVVVAEQLLQEVMVLHQLVEMVEQEQHQVLMLRQLQELVVAEELVGKMDLQLRLVQAELVVAVLVEQMVEIQEQLELVIQVVVEEVLQVHQEKQIQVEMVVQV